MPMHEKKSIQSCLSHCEVTLKDLQEITNTAQNNQAKSDLNQAVQSLTQCIKQCQNAQNKF